jgi:hypothetical protein
LAGLDYLKNNAPDSLETLIVAMSAGGWRSCDHRQAFVCTHHAEFNIDVLRACTGARGGTGDTFVCLFI